MERAALMEMPRWKSEQETNRARKEALPSERVKPAKKRCGAGAGASAPPGDAPRHDQVPKVASRLTIVITAPKARPIAGYPV